MAAVRRVLASRHPGSAGMVLSTADGEQVEVPEPLLRLLDEAVDALARGDTVRVVPTRREVTTSQAAALLNVSRPHLIHLVERDGIPIRREGTHRRIPLQALLDYKHAREAAAEGALQELVEMGEAARLYDAERSAGAARR